MPSKKQLCFVFGCTRDFAFAVGVVIQNLMRVHQHQEFDIVIFHDGISEEDQNVLSSFHPIRFVKYHFPVQDKKVLKAKYIRYFTPMVFSKFETINLLSEYKQAVWLDYDIVIRSKLHELLEPRDSFFTMMETAGSVRDQFLSEVKGFDMTRPGLSAGTFAVNDVVEDYSKVLSYCYSSVAEYAQILYQPEQGIIDLAIQKFDLSVRLVDPKKYALHPKYDDGQAVILHSYGPIKFWDSMENESWNNDYLNWLQSGGSKYKPRKVRKKAIKLLRKIGL